MKKLTYPGKRDEKLNQPNRNAEIMLRFVSRSLLPSSCRATILLNHRSEEGFVTITDEGVTRVPYIAKEDVIYIEEEVADDE